MIEILKGFIEKKPLKRKAYDRSHVPVSTTAFAGT
jgi:hypothetical protein